MQKLEPKKLYINYQDIVELRNYGGQGKLIEEIVEIPEVSESVKMLNILAASERMYPLDTPFTPFADCDIEDVRCVIVGGVPMVENISEWLGSGYCYENDSKILTQLHMKFEKDFSIFARAKINSDLQALRSNGVLILHDVLSMTKGGLVICPSLWEPFIWMFLSKFSEENAAVPIVFTTPLSDAKFGDAVMSSKHVFRANVHRDEVGVSDRMFALVESYANKGMVTTKLNFEREIIR